jgi:hypothetical protein
MRYIIGCLAILLTLAACSKKDTYGYNCRCTDKTTGAEDTFFTIRVQTFGEAGYTCEDHADTVNAYGGNLQCKID